MKFKFIRFNIYFWMMAILIMAGLGCSSFHKKKKETTTMEFHLEVNPDGSPYNIPATIFREHPIILNVEKEPFVDSVDVIDAKVIDDLGGFVIQLNLNWRGTQLLQAITASNHGRRIAIMCNFAQSRWLAAPMIQRQISNGVFTFTPDCTREEADRIVKGLRNVAEEIKKQDKF